MTSFTAYRGPVPGISEPPPGTIAVLLAAGGGRRFGGSTHKLLAVHDGRTVWQHSLGHLLDAGFRHTIVVTGATALHPLPPEVTHVHHPGWADGQAGSLRAGVAAAEALGADHVVVGLADQPAIPASAWKAIAGARPAPITVATYDGETGPNPVRLRADVWPLLPASGDAGARHVIAAHPEWVTTVACLGSAFDIDTWEDLRRWKSS